MTKLEDELIEPTPNSLTYGSYLQIDRLLALQKPISSPAEHDEMLFILIHQVYELWFKQILHEVEHCIRALKRDEPLRCLRTLKRINAIQQILTDQIDVLETMTPNDFNRFRKNLNPASGFQSVQFRVLEFLLGSKNEAYLKFHVNDPKNHTLLKDALAAPTLYDYFLQYLARQNYAIPSEVLSRDFSQEHAPHKEITNAFVEVYSHCEDHYNVFLMLEALADLDEKFLLWRFRHVAMVTRMIGTNRGTGGSTGANYLTKTLVKRFFPEIWEARNYLYPSENGNY